MQTFREFITNHQTRISSCSDRSQSIKEQTNVVFHSERFASRLGRRPYSDESLEYNRLTLCTVSKQGCFGVPKPNHVLYPLKDCIGSEKDISRLKNGGNAII
jgi:hypothetical protein